MTTLLNSFEGGTSGTTISAGNSGGVSGNAFDAVAIGATATATFDNAHAAHGGLSGKITTGRSAGTSVLEWNTSLGSLATVYWRAYLYLAGTPSPLIRFAQTRAGATHAASALVGSSGLAAAYGSGFTQQPYFTNIPPLNQWFRVEGAFTGNASTGAITLSLFEPMDAVLPLETHTYTGLNTTGTLTQYWFGQNNSSANSGPVWLDDVGFSDQGFLGPYGAIIIGTTPVLLGSCPAASQPYPRGQVTVLAGGAPIYLGASGVTSSNGAQVAAGATVGVPLFPGDQIWACTASGTSTATVLQTGA